MYRFAMLLALLLALAAAGCGGSGDDSDSPASAVVEASDNNEPSTDDGDEAASEADSKKKDEAADKSSKDDEKAETTDDDPETQEEASQEAGETFTELPSDRKQAAVETVARSALLAFNLKLVDLELQNGGRKATAVVARKGTCNFVASQEPNLEASIKNAVPGLRSMRFEVAGTGQELGYYVLSCKQPELPSGAGRVVFEHGGVGGPYEKRFKITSKRWALEWVNEAASLAVVIVPVGGESKDEYFKPVGSQKRESGRFEYRGAGTFQIKAHGAGGWQLRVKEIG